MKDRLDKIEAQIQGASNIPEGTKAELLQLLQELKQEVAVLAEKHGVQPESVDAALEGLGGPVSEFETTHPKLTQMVNRLAAALSSVGI